MNYRRLGRSGLKVSEIALGSWTTYGGSVDTSDAVAIIRRAFELGVNLFDTADVYVRGAAESVLGEALRGLPREQLVIATKCMGRVWDGPLGAGLSRKHVFDAVDDALDLTVRTQDRAVDRAPIALLKLTAVRLGAANVVLLHGHRVGLAAPPDPLERRTEVPGTARLGVLGVVGEHLEETVADDRFTGRHRGGQEGVARRDDPEVRIEDEVETGDLFEESLEIGQCGSPSVANEHDYSHPREGCPAQSPRKGANAVRSTSPVSGTSSREHTAFASRCTCRACSQRW